MKRFTEVAYEPSFYPRGSKFSLFSRQRFPRYWLILQIAIFGHEAWKLRKVPNVAYGPCFYPRGSKYSLFSFYRQRFPRYEPLFKIAIFGHDTWNLKKSARRSCIWTLFLLQGVEIKLISALRAAVSKIPRFQNCHIWK